MYSKVKRCKYTTTKVHTLTSQCTVVSRSSLVTACDVRSAYTYPLYNLRLHYNYYSTEWSTFIPDIDSVLIRLWAQEHVQNVEVNLDKEV